jgi:hypothetical protein
MPKRLVNLSTGCLDLLRRVVDRDLSVHSLPPADAAHAEILLAHKLIDFVHHEARVIIRLSSEGRDLHTAGHLVPRGDTIP